MIERSILDIKSPNCRKPRVSGFSLVDMIQKVDQETLQVRGLSHATLTFFRSVLDIAEVLYHLTSELEDGYDIRSDAEPIHFDSKGGKSSAHSMAV